MTSREKRWIEANTELIPLECSLCHSGAYYGCDEEGGKDYENLPCKTGATVRVLKGTKTEWE